MVVLTSFTQPTDGVRHQQNNTTVFVNDNNIGKGTLYIAESSLSWVSDSGSGFSIEYPHISLHAVSRDLSAFPQECLFLMLDTALGDEETNNGAEEDNNENENGLDEQETTQIRLVPDDRGMLDAMFHAMNVCQALHPDSEDSFSDEDFFEDAEDVEDNDVLMEDAHSQMANLQIESMDGRRHMLGREGGMEEDRVGGREVGMVGAGMIRTSEDRAGGRGVGMAGVCMIRTSEDRVGGILGDRVGGTLGGRVGGTLDRGDILADRAEDRVADIKEDSISASGTVLDDRSFSLGNMRRLGRMAGFPAAHSSQMDLEEDSNFVDAEN